MHTCVLKMLLYKDLSSRIPRLPNTHSFTTTCSSNYGTEGRISSPTESAIHHSWSSTSEFTSTIPPSQPITSQSVPAVVTQPSTSQCVPAVDLSVRSCCHRSTTSYRHLPLSPLLLSSLNRPPLQLSLLNHLSLSLFLPSSLKRQLSSSTTQSVPAVITQPSSSPAVITQPLSTFLLSSLNRPPLQLMSLNNPSFTPFLLSSLNRLVMWNVQCVA